MQPSHLGGCQHDHHRGIGHGNTESIDELTGLGLEHSRRSRLEPGCISHAVSRDVENPCRLLFVERWSDMAAVRTHFGVKASGDFVRRAIAMSDLPPTLELFEATLAAA